MKIKKGRDRVVFILPWLGIVIKFPISHPYQVLVHHYYLIKDYNKFIKGGAIKLFFRYFKNNVEYPDGFRGAMFGGLHSNWLEYMFWKRTKNPFLKPTYFSLFGLINIQKYGRVCEINHLDFWSQIRNMTKNMVYDNPHHFSNPQNFTLEDGKLQIIDYGNSRVYNVIVHYGLKISREFDQNYSWEEVKKKLQQQGL